VRDDTYRPFAGLFATMGIPYSDVSLRGCSSSYTMKKERASALSTFTLVAST
jgi:hypothetical protein